VVRRLGFNEWLATGQGDQENDMKGKSCWVAMALVLLVGCSSQGTKYDSLPPVMGGPSAAAPRAAKQTELSDGPGIAALINKNYNEDTTSCTDYVTGSPRGYYFCTGVLLRTTDFGNFKPWESSSTALALRATSYSWIRHDIGINQFYKAEGFVLLSPADVLADAVPGVNMPLHSNRNPVVKCIYPFDAYTTRTMNRDHFGCDLEGTGIGPFTEDQWGSCDNRLGYSTSAQWNTHFRNEGELIYKQCSWNSDNPQGWRNAIASYSSFPGAPPWNEIMLANYGGTDYVALASEYMRQWVVAFFYDAAKLNESADAVAVYFQDMMARTGKRVPVLRLDFSAPAAQRFAYRAQDQGPNYP
jgi:hypothetical protein